MLGAKESRWTTQESPRHLLYRYVLGKTRQESYVSGVSTQTLRSLEAFPQVVSTSDSKSTFDVR